MFDEQTLIIINLACNVFLVVMLIVLIAATRMKGGAGWAAVIAFFMNIPINLVNLMRDVTFGYYLLFMYPAYTTNLLIFPSMWLFAKSQMDKSFRLTPRHLYHAIPALVSLVAHIIYYAPLSAEQVTAEMVNMNAGDKNLPGIINDVLLYLSLIVYVTLIVRYVRQKMKYFRDNFSDTGYNEIRWTPRFLTFYFSIIFISAVAYTIDPTTETWLCPILLVAAMAFLAYCVIYQSTAGYIHRLPDEAGKAGEIGETGAKIRGGSLGEAQMKEICDKVMNYLTTSKAYTNPDYSLAMLSVETGIPYTNLSRSINGYMKKTFFDIINEMRVEEAKKRLRAHGSNFTIESVGIDCGFRSKSSFYDAFKKVEGKTPLQWMKSNL